MHRLAIGLLLLVPLAASGPPKADALRIRDLEVRLFYHHSGSFSGDITAEHEHPFVLWNTLIGEGDAKEPSTSLLATVVVEGPASSFRAERVIEFEAVEASGDPLYSASSRVGVLGPNGLHHTGFWLAEVSCKDIRLKARVRGTSTEIEESITFDCGE